MIKKNTSNPHAAIAEAFVIVDFHLWLHGIFSAKHILSCKGSTTWDLIILHMWEICQCWDSKMNFDLHLQAHQHTVIIKVTSLCFKIWATQVWASIPVLMLLHDTPNRSHNSLERGQFLSTCRVDSSGIEHLGQDELYVKYHVKHLPLVGRAFWQICQRKKQSFSGTGGTQDLSL